MLCNKTATNDTVLQRTYMYNFFTYSGSLCVSYQTSPRSHMTFHIPQSLALPTAHRLLACLCPTASWQMPKSPLATSHDLVFGQQNRSEGPTRRYADATKCGENGAFRQLSCSTVKRTATNLGQRALSSRFATKSLHFSRKSSPSTRPQLILLRARRHVVTCALLRVTSPTPS